MVEAELCSELLQLGGPWTSHHYRWHHERHEVPQNARRGEGDHGAALRLPRGCLFQQDNAPCHKAKKVMAWFRDEDVPLIPWPAQSPDLNPIEPLRDELDRRIRKRKPLPTNLTELKTAFREEWEQIPPMFTRNSSSA